MPNRPAHHIDTALWFSAAENISSFSTPKVCGGVLVYMWTIIVSNNEIHKEQAKITHFRHAFRKCSASCFIWLVAKWWKTFTKQTASSVALMLFCWSVITYILLFLWLVWLRLLQCSVTYGSECELQCKWKFRLAKKLCNCAFNSWPVTSNRLPTPVLCDNLSMFFSGIFWIVLHKMLSNFLVYGSWLVAMTKILLIATEMEQYFGIQ